MQLWLSLGAVLTGAGLGPAFLCHQLYAAVPAPGAGINSVRTDSEVAKYARLYDSLLVLGHIFCWVAKLCACVTPRHCNPPCTTGAWQSQATIHALLPPYASACVCVCFCVRAQVMAAWPPLGRRLMRMSLAGGHWAAPTVPPAAGHTRRQKQWSLTATGGACEWLAGQGGMIGGTSCSVHGRLERGWSA